MTSIIEQYRIISRGAGWSDSASPGRLKFTGPDRIPFLQGLLTNDVSALAPGRGVYAGYLTPNGRMLADLTLIDTGEALTALVGEGQGRALAERFDQLIFAEDVTVTDISDDTAAIFVTGGGAAGIVGATTGIDPAVLDALPELGHVAFGTGFVSREGASPLPAFRLVSEAGAGQQIRQALEDGGAIELDPELVTALRIEAGRALWGRELGDDVIPLEAGLLERAISTTKGCYVGQEIVIRILHRGGGRVARRLVTLAFEAAAEDAVRPAPGTELHAGGAGSPVAGRLTSVAYSPIRKAVVALGYLQRDAAEVGRVVTVANSEISATVIGLAG